VIPVEWEVKSFGELYSISAGGDFKSATSSVERDANHLYPIYSNALTAAGLYGYSTHPRHPEGSITITARGMIGSANFRAEPYTAIGRVLVLESKVQSDGRFFSDYINHGVTFAIESTGVPQLTAPQISGYRLAVPSFAEQRAIAEALGNVDALLGALDAAVAKQRDLKQATMQQLLTGQTRLPGFEGEWETKRLREAAELNRINVIPAKTPTHLFSHYSLPAFDAGNGPIVEFGATIESNKFGVPDKAVLVSKLNPRIPRVWAPDDVPPNAVASTEFLILTPTLGMSRDFLYALCGSPDFSEKMQLSATGTTGSHQRISPGTALNIEVKVPPTEFEQAAIATILLDLDATQAALECRRTKTTVLKQAMMQSLLTGRIRLL